VWNEERVAACRICVPDVGIAERRTLRFARHVPGPTRCAANTEIALYNASELLSCVIVSPCMSSWLRYLPAFHPRFDHATR
jgi:hypothetical protein